ncbi:VWA domain-containing protein [Chloroflexota bacterium]
MFTDFFYILRKRKVPVSISEWMTLMEALAKGCITNLDEFYFLARAILVKSETYFDHYDVAFQEYFQGIETPAEIIEQVLEWLKDPLNRLAFTEDVQDQFDRMDFDELLRELEKRLKEQTGQHDGGGYWIGRGGISPFGHSGSHPAGIRIGGESGGRHAIQIAQERRFSNYRSDLTLDVRQIKIALKGLRQLIRVGLEDELDLEETIGATAKNYGEIELVWRRSRKNAVKVLLLMDVGGSMEPFALLCSQLFSAAHSSTHFKDFQYYYFHNCIYDNLYQDIERQEAMSTTHLLNTLEPDYKLLLVGDARMAPYELVEKYGAIDYYERNETPGIAWLKRVAEHFTHSVWLNPDDPRFWVHPTVKMVGKTFPMFPLTLDGLGQAVKKLVVKK